MSDQPVPQEKDAKSVPAPYLPFKTFLSSFDVFDHGLPGRIDRSMWRSQSGVVQGQIVMALRFFGLVDDKDQPRPSLDRFISNKDERKQYVKALLHHAYKSILDHDLTRMTPKMLSDEMDIFGLSGDTKRKAAGFFIRAAQFAELPMHPLLTAQSRNSPAVARKRRKGSGANGTVVDTPPNTHQPEGRSDGVGDTKTVVLASGAVVTLRVSANWLELPSAERKYVFDLIDMLQAPSAPTSHGKSKEEDS